ncbi:hypothetical protein IB238_14420 [Rhizobium sp. ARZ01]|uniref:hypothetical protein n=1 Tax=Rhizobium sp. ARZ01 TaxID=2769313 RepID=UPI00177E249A|nr:hypothetical protein [Rhizobium sp. ARZ01]MBD9373819.1 hypothetical protein [Rhizobium sp. ARZ01]
MEGPEQHDVGRLGRIIRVPVSRKRSLAMPAEHRRPAARAIAIAATEENRRHAVGLAFNCAAAALLLAIVAATTIAFF